MKKSGSIFNILDKPFPYEYDLKSNLKYSVWFGLFIAIFLVIFRPFGIGEEGTSLKLYVQLSGFGLITSLSLFVNIFLLNFIFLKFRDETNWKLKHEMLMVIYVLFFISVMNTFYKAFIYHKNLHAGDFAEFIYYTFAIGFLPVLLGLLFAYNKNLKKNLTEANKLNLNLPSPEVAQNDELVNITDETGKEKISLKLDDLYFIKAAGNYTEIFIKEQDSLKPLLLRASLKKAEETFSSFASVFKCHRTYIVNLDKVKEILGNSQGYLLLFEYEGYSVPVSRSYSKELSEKLKQKK